MFSVRCQTPSAGAEEIHPTGGWDGGRRWEEGRAKRGEMSARSFLSARFPSLQCHKQSRPDLDGPRLGGRPGLLRDRGDDGRSPGWWGPRTTACNHDCSPCTRGLHAKPHALEETDTSANPSAWPGLAELCSSQRLWGLMCGVGSACPHSSDPGQPLHLISSHSAPLSHLAGARSGPAPRSPAASPVLCWPQSPAVFAPRGPRLWATN